MTKQNRDCKAEQDPITLGAIFRSLGKDFVKRRALSQRQRQAFRALAACRTAALGGAVWQCQSCGHRVGVYHSCRDRHCPQCQAMARFHWVADRVSEVLPVPYYHTVFTLPHDLNDLIKANRSRMIGSLFRAVSQTLKTFAANPKHMGARPGWMMVLHTWGRQLNFHVHLHCVITGGGLSADGDRWVPCRKKDFLFPVKALSRVFRGKYLEEVGQMVKAGKLLNKSGSAERLSRESWCRRRARSCRNPWVVYAKKPFGGPVQVLKYLGAYTHRVAISNRRILSFEKGTVAFGYKDYKAGGENRVLRLPADEFAQRFLQHILPKGLMRIRYGGFLASCIKKKSLARCRALLGEVDLEPEQVLNFKTGNEEPAETDQKERKCPACGKKTLVIQETVDFQTYEAARLMIYDSS